MSSAGRFAAVDLGASGGRVVVGDIAHDRAAMTTVHRFPNSPVRTPDGLHWDILHLYGSILTGLSKAANGGDLTSIGVDSWAVDYGLLDADGALLGNPYHYRDSRNEPAAIALHELRSPAELYEVNGLQYLPFNTIYQLAASAGTAQRAHAQTLLLIPDLIGCWLTGTLGAEITNASTTGLLDARTRAWSDELCALVADRSLLPTLREPGEPVGELRDEVALDAALPRRTRVVAVGSHDTASAVVAVPMNPETAVYISLGTWGLVGVELEKPVLTEESRLAGFTNELGVDGRVRYLRNVTGLWLLQECLRTWGDADLEGLLAAAAVLPAGGPQFDVDDPQFLAPGDMPARIAAAVTAADHPPPRGRAEVVRAIIDSLATALARAAADAGRLSGRQGEVIHVVGGGAQNALLCQQLADTSGLPVVAGPVEATALGNLLVQARAAGTITGSLEALRDLVMRMTSPASYLPRVRR